jgi:hypothetical protein
MTEYVGLPIAEKPKPDPRRGPARPPEPGPAKAPTKLEQIVILLSRTAGASLADLVAATGWQAHSVRGALAGSLKRKGHAIVSEKVDGEHRYRIGAGQ